MGLATTHVILAVIIPVVFTVFAVLFVFLIINYWFRKRRKEREAFYKSETLKRITEASGEGAKQAIELLREDWRLKEREKRESMKIGGLINIGVGIALVPALWKLIGIEGGLCGLIPGLIGVALLVYVYFLAAPLEDGPKA